MPYAPAVATRANSSALQRPSFQTKATTGRCCLHAVAARSITKRINMSCSHVVADEVARGNFEDTGPDRDWGDRNEALLALQRLWISAF